MRDEAAIPQGEDLHETGELSADGGIVSGRLVEFSEVLDRSPSEVLSAIESEEIALLLDTAESKPRETHDRPTDPTLRCLAMTEGEWVRLSLAAGRPAEPERPHKRTFTV